MPSVPIPPHVQQVLQQRQKQGVVDSGSSVASSTDFGGEKPMTASSPNLVAYERKKQKAKAGRVQLNEAIERLSVAINVAGSQARKRVDAFSSMLSDPNTAKTMLACEAAASAAKKYDRPSFIGAAAAVVQALNDQCEALVNEVRILKDRATQIASVQADPLSFNSNVSFGSPYIAASRPSAGAPQPLTMASGSAVMSGFGEASMQLQSQPQSQPLLLSPSPSEHRNQGMSIVEHQSSSQVQKKQRLSYSSIDTEFNIATASPTNRFACLLAQDPVLKLIGLFLDPISLTRCRCVCHAWNAIEEFTSDGTWKNLCIKRFGEEKVSLWEEKFPAFNMSSMRLYREMSASNVQPLCAAEGNVKLGEAKADGVSAWASMMSRSNGETLRSVKRVPTTKNGSGGEVEFSAMPLVEIRIVVQNTGIHSSITIPDQSVTVDASTRRRHEELAEITSDDRFVKEILTLDGNPVCLGSAQSEGVDEIFRLRLFDAAVLLVHIHARGCCTTSKFLKKTHFSKLLVKANGKTWPVVIPFTDNEDVLCIKKLENA